MFLDLARGNMHYRWLCIFAYFFTQTFIEKQRAHYLYLILVTVTVVVWQSYLLQVTVKCSLDTCTDREDMRRLFLPYTCSYQTSLYPLYWNMFVIPYCDWICTHCITGWHETTESYVFRKSNQVYSHVSSIPTYMNTFATLHSSSIWSYMNCHIPFIQYMKLYQAYQEEMIHMYT